MLGVSPNTLRSWERRFGFPEPRRTRRRPPPVRPGRDRGAARGLRGDAERVLGDRRRARARRRPGLARSSALRLHPLRRGRGRPDPRGEPRRPLGRAHRRGGPARRRRDARARRRPDGPEYGFAWRWATGWLAAAVRASHRRHARRRRRHLRLERPDATSTSLHAQALELALRRRGLRTLTLAAGDSTRRARPRPARRRAARVVLAGRQRRPRRARPPRLRARRDRRRGHGDLRLPRRAARDRREHGHAPRAQAARRASTRSLGRVRRARAVAGRADGLDGLEGLEGPTAPRAPARSPARALRVRRGDDDPPRCSFPATRWPTARSSRCCARRRTSGAGSLWTSSARASRRRGSSCSSILATAGGELELRACAPDADLEGQRDRGRRHAGGARAGSRRSGSGTTAAPRRVALTPAGQGARRAPLPRAHRARRARVRRARRGREAVARGESAASSPRRARPMRPAAAPGRAITIGLAERAGQDGMTAGQRCWSITAMCASFFAAPVSDAVATRPASPGTTGASGLQGARRRSSLRSMA